METPDLYSKITRSDNSNPLAISLGNPNLKNSRKTNVSLTCYSCEVYIVVVTIDNSVY